MINHKKSSKENILDVVNMSPDDTRRLNCIAFDIKKEYTKFIDEITMQFSKNELIWSVPLISRNIYNDDTFIKLCRLLLICDKVSRESYDRVIVETEGEAKCLIDNGIVDYAVARKGQRSLIHIKKEYEVWKQVLKLLKCEKKIKHYSNGKNCLITSNSTIIFTPALSSGFKNGEYQDRYFTGILDYTNRDLVFMPSLNMNGGYTLQEFISNLYNAPNYSFFFLESFFNIHSYIDLFKYFRLCSIMQRKRYFFRNIDVSSIIYESLLEGKESAPALKGVLYNSYIKNMKTEYSGIKSFVVWYEGRPNDVMEVASIRKHYPSAACVAYEAYPLDEMTLSLYISDYQNKSHLAPTRVAIPSKNMYQNEFYNYSEDTKLIEVPILRTNFKSSSLELKKKAGRKVLLLLPYSIEVSRTIIEMVDDCLSQAGYEYSVIIKNHPINKELKIRDYTSKKIGFVPTFENRNVTDLASEANVVVTSNTSASFEVLFSGSRMIIINPRGKIRKTDLPSGLFENRYALVYSQGELNIEFRKMTNNINENLEPMENVFLDANKENIERIFE